MSWVTACRSRWPWSMPEMRARFVFSQSCSALTRVVSRRFSIIWLMLSLSSATSPCGLDRDRPRQVALGHRGGHLGDRAHLRGQVAGELVDVLGEVAPRAGHALDAGLTAELALGADLARDARDLVGERGQLVDHDVDRLLELEDLALRVDRDLLAEVAVGDRGRDLGDVADLARQVRGHEVDVVGQVAPRARDARHVGLAAELALGADLARDARDLVGERATAARPSC